MQIPVFIDIFNALGANAVPMPFPELYSALEQKAVDGQENPFIIGRGDQVLRGAEVRSRRPATCTRRMLVLVSKKFWDQLSADEHKILRTRRTRSQRYQRQVSREMDAKARRARSRTRAC